jgi:hypothetical protein
MEDLSFITWKKSQGPVHYAPAGFYSETLCGIPMLGNNYQPLPEDSVCAKCHTLRTTYHEHPDTLDKDTAVDMLREGHKLRHRLFESEEWIQEQGDYLKTEDGALVSKNGFWSIRTTAEWNKDWSITF